MTTRRRFIQQTSLAGIALGLPGSFSRLTAGDPFTYASPYLRLQLMRDRPAFSFFSTDSLGGGQLSVSPLMKAAPSQGAAYQSRVTGGEIAYFTGAGKSDIAVWTCSMQPKSFSLRTRTDGTHAEPFAVTFSQKANHCTVLGTMSGDKQVKFPCVLHFPGMGTFRVFCSDPDIRLFYNAELTEQPFVQIALPAADAGHPDITYRFDSVAIFPDAAGIKNDPRYDGFRKNFINIFQLSPGFKTLANNSTSDACAFTLFLYAEMAQVTPALAEGLTAMDLVRNSLDRYFEGMLGYGMVGKHNWQSKYNSSDSFPSLIMSACYYIQHTRDREWGMKNYAGIRSWAEKMIATDTNKDGIIEYGYSGNSGSWDNKQGFKRPANWWDTIGFGHDDAYSNALAYRAAALMKETAAFLGKKEDENYFSDFGGRLKKNYYTRFYNPATGVLGGWRSADGQLHDYYFTFVNSIAICYGLVEKKAAKKIMQRLLDKMKAVGYTDFRLGLPGNLIPIADEDYAHHDPRWGYQRFQVYENGGASGCYVYYTLHALYKLGMRDEAERILMPMLESYKNGSFEGSCPGGKMTRDWKTWSGECWGYEGFLVDNYLALKAVLDR
ncbi:hypothetical protein [Compostibacter hankyongensis]|uniref:Alpha-L-rhamnosidase six-hairpin glycosidase domain-containing protein n=1 Tax=Compostibacter hankyongensis TaxID=1007089 RepID=A0ABP8FIH8_9BACT